MPYHVKAGVIGAAILPRIESSRQSLEEVLYDVTRRALHDAGLSIGDIDGIIVGGNDQYDGRAITVMMASGPVGGVDRDILSTPSAGEHAFVMGALRIGSGHFRTQLVLAWSPTEAGSLAEVQRLAADPYFHRRLPQDEMGAHAMQANVLLSKMPELATLARKIAAKNRANGARAYPDLVSAELPDHDPKRWPLERGEVSPAVSGAVALVLASDDFIAEHARTDVAWIAGIGWATEPAFIGDRDLAEVPSLVEAARQAYAEAGITAPLETIDIAELGDATPYQELLACEALGLAPRDTWAARVADGTFAATGSLPVNLSGGAHALNPVYCTGLIRIAEIAQQIRGRAGRHQLAGVSTGLAHAASGDAMQYNTVVVLRREMPGDAS